MKGEHTQGLTHKGVDRLITISLCMIVKNEESVLERCLSSIADAVDEIVIVDTGSTDRTKEIASEFTDKIYDFEWINDFSKARNESYSKATMEYQMWLDADDILLPEEKDKLIDLKKTLSGDVDMVMMKYNTNFDEKGNPILTSHRERLTKREKNYKWQEPVHECIPLSGNVFHSDITITHKKEDYERTSGRNLMIYEKLEKSGKRMNARQLYYFARELKDHGQYKKAIRYFDKFLVGKQGWIEDNIGACFNLAVCYRTIDEQEKRLESLFRSFQYDSPRAEICCEIGYYYKDRQDYKQAIDWFRIALALGEPVSMGFILRDYWGYIPHIELCVCYYKLGNIEKAEYHNTQAGLLKPYAKAVELNTNFFNSLKSEK